MDDFEKEYPDFDWRNTPAHKHPGGPKKCPCPKHEYVRDKLEQGKRVTKETKDFQPLVLRFCPPHYDVYFNEAYREIPFKYKIIIKICLKLGLVKIVKLKHMESDLCYYCKFGSGGFDKKTELPPIP